MSPTFTGIVAMAENRAIGIGNRIPWKLPEDMKLFKRLTMGHPILMGRKTWESLGRPLPGRQNIVLTRTPGYHAPGAHVIHQLEELRDLELQDPEIMVIGGGELYQFMLPRMKKLYVSEVAGIYAADTYFPPFAHLFLPGIPLEHHEGFSLILYRQR